MPVTIGGLVIHPGDIVIGDEDGVVAVSPAIAPEVLAAARLQAQREDKAKADIVAGRYDRSWVDAALRAKGALPSGA